MTIIGYFMLALLIVAPFAYIFALNYFTNEEN